MYYDKYFTCDGHIGIRVTWFGAATNDLKSTATVHVKLLAGKGVVEIKDNPGFVGNYYVCNTNGQILAFNNNSNFEGFDEVCGAPNSKWRNGSLNLASGEMELFNGQEPYIIHAEYRCEPTAGH